MLQLLSKEWLLKISTIVVLGLAMRKIVDLVVRKWHRYPPGCIGFPLFGSYFQCSQYKYMASLTKHYGPILMIYVGMRPLILVDDLKLCQQLFHSSAGSKRGRDYCVMGEAKRSLTESHGQSLTLRRKLLHRSFVTILDSTYLNEIGIHILERNLFNVFDEAMQQKQSITLRFHVKYAVFSLIFSTIFGDYLDLPDKSSYLYHKLYIGMEKSLNKFGDYQNEMMMYPHCTALWRWFLDKLFRFQIIEGMHLLDDVISVFIEQLLNADTVVRDDIYIKPHLDAFKNGQLTFNALKSDIQSIFVAGMHTTSLIFSEVCVMCAKHADIQQAVYEEVSAFERKYGRFEIKHWSEFPLLRALVHEMLRWGFVDALSGVPRVITDDGVHIGDYNLPKGAIVYGFYAKFMHQYRSGDGYVKWKNPARFDLNNFLDESGKFQANHAFSTFGIGRRNCPGESLAKREIYLLLARTLLRYRLVLDHDIDHNTKDDNIPCELNLADPDSQLHVKILETPVRFIQRSQ